MSAGLEGVAAAHSCAVAAPRRPRSEAVSACSAASCCSSMSRSMLAFACSTAGQAHGKETCNKYRY